MNNFYCQTSMPLCLLILMTLQPSQVCQEAPVRVGKTLFITLDPQSPSLAAFNDSRMEFSQSNEIEVYRAKETIELQAGHFRFLDGRSLKGIKARRKARRKLSGLTVSLSSRAVRLAQNKSREVGVTKRHLTGFQGESFPVDRSFEEKRGPSSPTKRPEVLANQGSLPVYMQSPTKREGPGKASRSRGKTETSTNKLTTEEKRGPSSPTKRPEVLANQGSLPVYIQSATKRGKPGKVPRPRGKTETSTSKLTTVGKYVDPGPVQVSLYELSGSLEMMGGLAYTGIDTHLSVSRMVHGQVMNKGDIIVNVKTSIYKILVSDLKGHIVVKLYGSDDRILGFGEFDLYQLPDRAKKLSQIDRLHIKVKPYDPSVVASLYSGQSWGKHRILANGSRMTTDSPQSEMNKESENRFSDAEFLPHSSLVMRAKKKNHWGSLVVGVNGRENGVRIYPDSMVRALLDSQGVSGGSVIWGRVTRNGQPVRGVQVELAGDFISKPVYFNAYIPDSKLESTETDGLFAFVGVSSGIQAVRATIGGEYISTQVIPAEEDHVSYLEIEIMDDYRTAGVSVYDGLTREALRADVQIYGTEEVMDIDGLKEEAIHFPGGSGIMMIEVDAGDNYLPSRYSIHRLQQSIELPMVQADWLNGMRTDQHMGLTPEFGIIVGYVKGSDYDVFMDQGLEYDSKNIIYFDRDGHITYDTGKAGGGFILFNVPVGIHTVTVLPVATKKVFTQVAVVGHDAINVLYSPL